MKRRLLVTAMLIIGMSVGVMSHEDARAYNHKAQIDAEPCAASVENQAQQKGGTEERELIEFSPIYQMISFI